MPEWFTDVPTAVSLLAFLGFFLLFAAGGVMIFRRVSRLIFGMEGEWRDLATLCLQAGVTFFALLLALLSFAAYQNYTEARIAVSSEAASLAVMYREGSSLPEPDRGVLQADLRAYTAHVINKEWGEHRQGEAPESGQGHVRKIQNGILSFQGKTPAENNIQSALISAFKDFINARRQRLTAASVGVPGLLWSVLVMGVLTVIALTWFLPVNRARAHFFLSLSVAFAASLALYSIVAVDRPFKGSVSVPPTAFELVLGTTMR
ncbi:DUF4239 domain-containing protein [Streptomyces sp. NPDC008121]|uniref:bestrophin-like domain n=1 Tax=Streptomyces sp. NPDC008121 TaxID=3364809 RepID=UPI0036E06DFF